MYQLLALLRCWSCFLVANIKWRWLWTWMDISFCGLLKMCNSIYILYQHYPTKIFQIGCTIFYEFSFGRKSMILCDWLKFTLEPLLEEVDWDLYWDPTLLLRPFFSIKFLPRSLCFLVHNTKLLLFLVIFSERICLKIFYIPAIPISNRNELISVIEEWHTFVEYLFSRGLRAARNRMAFADTPCEGEGLRPLSLEAATYEQELWRPKLRCSLAQDGRSLVSTLTVEAREQSEAGWPRRPRTMRTKKWLRINCLLRLKIHNETWLLFSVFILATLHSTHSLINHVPALTTYFWQMHMCLEIEETIDLLFNYGSPHTDKDKWTIFFVL